MTTEAERLAGVIGYETSDPRRLGSRGLGGPRTWVRVGGRPGQAPAGDRSAPDAFSVKIMQRDGPHHAVIAELHDKPPTPTEEGGGWEEVPLPKRRAVLVWKGGGLLKLSMSVVFDGYQGERQVLGTPVQTLLHFKRPPLPTEEPSVLNIIARGDAVPYIKDVPDWVLTDITWGEAAARDDAVRTQQILDLVFTEFREDERLQTAASRKPRKRSRVVTVKADHELLSKIAERMNFKAGWRALGKVQKPPITDPRATHKGQRIVIPG